MIRTLVRYGVAVLTPALALLITLALGPLMERTTFALFYVAVIVSASYGGLGPGLVASTISVLVGGHFLLTPANSFNVGPPRGGAASRVRMADTG